MIGARDVSPTLQSQEIAFLPNKSLLLKCALHLSHVYSPVEWFSKWRCRCSALVKLLPQPSPSHTNLFPPFFPFTTSFLFLLDMVDVVVVPLETIANRWRRGWGIIGYNGGSRVHATRRFDGAMSSGPVSGAMKSDNWRSAEFRYLVGCGADMIGPMSKDAKPKIGGVREVHYQKWGAG